MYGLDMKFRNLADPIKEIESETEVTLKGWVVSRRNHGKIRFIDIEDRSGTIQVVAKEDNLSSEAWEAIVDVSEEACVEVAGDYDPEQTEVVASDFTVLSDAPEPITPKPRGNKDLNSEEHHDQILSNSHLYVRSDWKRDVLGLRDVFVEELQSFLRERELVDYTAPILTPLTLYDPETAFSTDFYGDDIYLTQCTAFYLEAAVPAFERVFYLSPTFRAEKSRSKRHLSEYWHIKGEIAFCDLPEMMTFVEELVVSCAHAIYDDPRAENFDIERDASWFEGPFEELTYTEAVDLLHEHDMSFEWGNNLGNDEEALLGEIIGEPFWVSHLPRKAEPFPYRVNPDDDSTTLTADLLVPGYGEVLGTAEKIYETEELYTRMDEEHSLPLTEEKYDWFVELREQGLPPHSGFGMGVERMLRAFLGLDHVRDAIPHPRLYPRVPRV